MNGDGGRSPALAITGIGVLSPAGHGPDVLRDVLRSGTSCVRQLECETLLDGWRPIGAPVPDFDARAHLDARHARRLDRSAQLFVAAGASAVSDSAVLDSDIDRTRIGVFEGTSLGGLGSALSEHELLLHRGPRAVHPTSIYAAMSGVGAGMISIMLNLHGPVETVTGGSVATACAIGAAAHQLRLIEIDAAIVGGGESPLHEHLLLLLRRAGMLSPGYGAPAEACRPFDAARDGTVLAEAGAAIVLERMSDALRRNAKIYAELAAVAFTSEAHSLIEPAPDAFHRARAFSCALQRAALRPEEVDYISAHGTATVRNDRTEARAIEIAFGAGAIHIPVSAMKSMLGHALGACTALELIGTIIAMETGFLPPTINLARRDSECNLNIVANESKAANIRCAIVTNAGFGGKNSAIVLRRGFHGSAGGRHRRDAYLPS